VPLYEYACRRCQRVFEELVFGKAPTPPCPGCAGNDGERLLSTVSVGRSDATEAGGPIAAGSCGSCGDPRGPGACARN
jgi:putative FmdB family regulatory protein